MTADYSDTKKELFIDEELSKLPGYDKYNFFLDENFVKLLTISNTSVFIDEISPFLRSSSPFFYKCQYLRYLGNNLPNYVLSMDGKRNFKKSPSMLKKQITSSYK